MEGSSRDQMEAAVITPAANPSITCSARGWRLLFIKKIKAAPSKVPKKGRNRPQVSRKYMKSSWGMLLISVYAFSLSVDTFRLFCYNEHNYKEALAYSINPIRLPRTFTVAPLTR
ncbi:MAG: hypothetical protein ACLRT5_04050 [Lachnospiraceae bacterium]